VILIVKSTLALLSLTAVVATLSGCGQTGELYMPTPPNRPAPAPLQVEQPAQPVPSNNASTPAPHR